MATAENEAVGISNALSYEEVLEKYKNLQESYDAVSASEKSTKERLEQALAELDNAKSELKENQRVRAETDVKLDLSNANERSIMELVASLRMELLKARDKENELNEQIASLNAQCLDLSLVNGRLSSAEATMKMRHQQLESANQTLAKQESTRRQQLALLESELDSVKEKYRLAAKNFATDKTNWQREREEFLNEKQELRLQLSQCKAEHEVLTERARSLQDRCEQLELSRASMKKAHQELVAIYDKQQKESERQVAEAKTAAATAETELQLTRERMHQENQSLQFELQKCQERLEVARERAESLMNGSATASSSENGAHDTPQPPSNLLRLIRQYEKSGRNWEDVYQEYFELQHAYGLLMTKNEDLVRNMERLIREQRDRDVYHERLEDEHRRILRELDTQRLRTREAEEANANNSKLITQMKTELRDLQKTRDDLQKVLQDTSYQVCYLVREVETLGGELPEGVQSYEDLIKYANTPGIDHDKVVFKNIQELQKRNQELLYNVRALTENIQEKDAEITRFAAEKARFNEAINESKGTIEALNEKIVSLEASINATSKERDMYRVALNESGQRATPLTATDSGELVEHYKKRAEEIEAEANAYRQEVDEDLKRLRTELDNAQNALTQTNLQLKRCEAEIIHWKEKSSNLMQSINLKQTELTETRQRNDELERRLDENERVIREINQEISQQKCRAEALNNENAVLKAELKGSESSYQRLLEEKNSLSVERNNLSQLLQQLNATVSLTNSQATQYVETLKEQVKDQKEKLESMREKLSAADRELQELKSVDNSQWQQKYMEASTELQRIKSTQSQLETDLAAAKDQRIVLETRLSVLEVELEQRRSGAAAPEGAETGAVSQDSSSTAEHNSLEVKAAYEEIERLRRVLAEYEEQSEKIKEELAKSNKEREQFVKDMETEMSKLHEDLAARNTRLQETESLINSLRQDNEEKTKLEEQWMAEKQQLSDEKVSLEGRIKELFEEISQLRTDLGEQTKMLKETEEKLQQEIETRNKAVQEAESFKSKVQQLSESLLKSQTESTQLQDRLKSDESLYNKQREQWETAEAEMKLRLEESRNNQDKLTEQVQELLAIVAKNRQSMTSESPDSEGLMDLSNRTVAQLRGVNASLRRENDMLHAQYNDVRQEFERVKNSYEFTQQQLTHTRSQLEKLREENQQIENRHIETTTKAQNEATVYKENNTQLRSTVAKLKERISQLEEQSAAKTAEVEPLLSKVRELEAEVQANKDTVQMLEKTKAEWSARTNQILSKYNKIDPAEVDKLKADLEEAKKNVQTIEAEKAQMEAKMNELENSKSESDSKVLKFGQIAQERTKAALMFKKRLEEAEAKLKAAEEAASKAASAPAPAPAPASPVAAAPATVPPELTAVEKKELEEQKQKIEELTKQVEIKSKEAHEQHTRYQRVLAQAKRIQQEKNQINEELKTSKVELEKLKKQGDDNLEMKRLQVKASMSSNKAKAAIQDLYFFMDKQNIPRTEAQQLRKRRREEMRTSK